MADWSNLIKKLGPMKLIKPADQNFVNLWVIWLMKKLIVSTKKKIKMLNGIHGKYSNIMILNGVQLRPNCINLSLTNLVKIGDCNLIKKLDNWRNKRKLVKAIYLTHEFSKRIVNEKLIFLQIFFMFYCYLNLVLRML